MRKVWVKCKNIPELYHLIKLGQSHGSERYCSLAWSLLTDIRLREMKRKGEKKNERKTAIMTDEEEQTYSKIQAKGNYEMGRRMENEAY